MAGYPVRPVRIRLRDGLPYVVTSLLYLGRQLVLDNVLLDTGSAGTIFAADKVSTIGLRYEAEDDVRRIRGIGGAEFVFTKRVDRLSIGELRADGFEIEAGVMDYGFEIDGIVGLDFLIWVGAIVDLARLEIYPAS